VAGALETTGDEDVESKVEQALLEFDELKSEALVTSERTLSRERLPQSP